MKKVLFLLAMFTTLFSSCGESAERRNKREAREATERAQIDARAEAMTRTQDSIAKAQLFSSKIERIEDDSLKLFTFFSAPASLKVVHPLLRFEGNLDSLDMKSWEVELRGEGETIGGLKFAWEFSQSVESSTMKSRDSLLLAVRTIYNDFTNEQKLIRVDWNKKGGIPNEVVKFYRMQYDKNVSISKSGTITTKDVMPEKEFQGFGHTIE